jgi:Zn-dependent oligopeptidase
MQSLKQIEEQQKELQAAIQTAKAEKEEMLERDRDFYDPKAKDRPPPKMEVRNALR